VALAGACVPGFLIAIYLQVLALFAIAGIVLWLVLVECVPWLLPGRLDKRLLWGMFVGALVLSLLAVAVVVETGTDSGWAWVAVIGPRPAGVGPAQRGEGKRLLMLPPPIVSRVLMWINWSKLTARTSMT
jgi:hypothetical protein